MSIMKAIILAGGLGTRISEESHLRPKPMIEIGGKPIIWHIMKMYSHHGVNDFVICLGYKGYIIKEYFSNYFLHMSDVTFCMRENSMEIHEKFAEPWKITLVDTGEQTVTAIQPPGRYGALHIENGAVKNFQEKPAGDGAWINGGFFVLEPGVLDIIDGDNTVWEQQPLQKLALQGQLTAYQHEGFWQAMDTLREKSHLEELWSSGKAPWKSW